MLNQTGNQNTSLAHEKRKTEKYEIIAKADESESLNDKPDTFQTVFTVDNTSASTCTSPSQQTVKNPTSPPPPKVAQSKSLKPIISDVSESWYSPESADEDKQRGFVRYVLPSYVKPGTSPSLATEERARDFFFTDKPIEGLEGFDDKRKAFRDTYTKYYEQAGGDWDAVMDAAEPLLKYLGGFTPETEDWGYWWTNPKEYTRGLSQIEKDEWLKNWNDREHLSIPRAFERSISKPSSVRRFSVVTEPPKKKGDRPTFRAKSIEEWVDAINSGQKIPFIRNRALGSYEDDRGDIQTVNYGHYLDTRSLGNLKSHYKYEYTGKGDKRKRNAVKTHYYLRPEDEPLVQESINNLGRAVQLVDETAGSDKDSIIGLMNLNYWPQKDIDAVVKGIDANQTAKDNFMMSNPDATEDDYLKMLYGPDYKDLSTDIPVSPEMLDPSGEHFILGPLEQRALAKQLVREAHKIGADKVYTPSSALQFTRADLQNLGWLKGNNVYSKINRALRESSAKGERLDPEKLLSSPDLISLPSIPRLTVIPNRQAQIDSITRKKEPGWEAEVENFLNAPPTFTEAIQQLREGAENGDARYNGYVPVPQANWADPAGMGEGWKQFSPYERDEEGNIIKDASGKPILKEPAITPVGFINYIVPAFTGKAPEYLSGAVAEDAFTALFSNNHSPALADEYNRFTDLFQEYAYLPDDGTNENKAYRNELWDQLIDAARPILKDKIGAADEIDSVLKSIRDYDRYSSARSTIDLLSPREKYLAGGYGKSRSIQKLLSGVYKRINSDRRRVNAWQTLKDGDPEGKFEGQITPFDLGWDSDKPTKVMYEMMPKYMREQVAREVWERHHILPDQYPDTELVYAARPNYIRNLSRSEISKVPLYGSLTAPRNAPAPRFSPERRQDWHDRTAGTDENFSKYSENYILASYLDSLADTGVYSYNTNHFRDMFTNPYDPDENPDEFADALADYKLREGYVPGGSMDSSRAKFFGPKSDGTYSRLNSPYRSWDFDAMVADESKNKGNIMQLWLDHANAMVSMMGHNAPLTDEMWRRTANREYQATRNTYNSLNSPEEKAEFLKMLADEFTQIADRASKSTPMSMDEWPSKHPNHFPGSNLSYHSFLMTYAPYIPHHSVTPGDKTPMQKVAAIFAPYFDANEKVRKVMEQFNDGRIDQSQLDLATRQLRQYEEAIGAAVSNIELLRKGAESSRRYAEHIATIKGRDDPMVAQYSQLADAYDASLRDIFKDPASALSIASGMGDEISVLNRGYSALAESRKPDIGAIDAAPQGTSELDAKIAEEHRRLAEHMARMASGDKESKLDKLRRRKIHYKRNTAKDAVENTDANRLNPLL